MQFVQGIGNFGITRQTFLLGFVELATWEQRARDGLVGTHPRLGFLSLLLGLEPAVERTCISAAMSGCVANAIADRVTCTVAREIILHFPRESARFLLASQRIGRFFGGAAVCSALREFDERLALAKAITVDFAADGFGPSKASSEAGLAGPWRQACAAGRELLSAIGDALAEHQIQGMAQETSPLLRLLEDVSQGRYPLLDANGHVEMPHWAEERNYKRVPVKCPVVVISGGQQQWALLRDISIKGLGLEGVRGLSLEDAVVVEVGESLSLPGAVGWVGESLAGIKLARPLHADTPGLNFLVRPN